MAKKTKITRVVVSGESKIFWITGKQNPFREGPGAFKRTELVRKASGKAREAIRGIRVTTIPTLRRRGVIRIAA